MTNTKNTAKREGSRDEVTPEPSLGDAGYRLRDSRTGWDPIDTSMEAARVEGQFIRSLFTLRLRTRNLLYILGMLIAGLMLLSPLLFTLIEVSSGSNPTLLDTRYGWNTALLRTVPMVVMGFFLLINAILSIIHWRG